MKKQIKAILFDFDGVLANTMGDNFLAWQKVFRDYGIDIKKEDYFPLEGMKLIEIAQKISNKYKIHPDPKILVSLKNKYYLKDHSLFFYPRVEELIDFLKSNKCLLAIVSASPRKKLLRTVQAEFLKKFDTVITGEDSRKGKPSPEPYLNAAKNLGVSPKDCVVIENAPLGIKSAKKAGIYCIAVCSTLDRPFLSEADEVINRFEDIERLEIIKSLINN
ncbi:HAD family phosphatase [bacterium]|nr:MAG: HAD family phosphatase [bacterium]